MTIVYIGTGKNIPTFIDRRIRQLMKREGVDLKVVAESGDAVPYPESHIVRLLKSKPWNVVQWMRYIWAIAFEWSAFQKLLTIRKKNGGGSSYKWAMKMLPLTRLGHVDVVHLQWISFVPEYEWLKSFYHCALVASARGAQVTIQPTVDGSRLTSLKEAISRADVVHCVSRSIKDQCIKWGAPDSKLKVIYNGIDTSMFQPSAMKVRNGPLALISVGALIWRKGYLYQLMLVKALKDAGKKVKLDIVGEGEDIHLLHYTIARLELQHEVSLLGQKTGTEVIALLQQSDIYISTSIAEGLSNSVVEAAAAGVPCFVFDCEGMDEVIEEGRGGYIVPFGNVDLLRDRIVSVSDGSGETLSRMGVTARKHIVDNFEESKCVDHLVDFYKEVSVKHS